MPKTLATVKNIVTVVVGITVGNVISTIIHNNCPVDKMPQKVRLTIGSFVLAAMVADHAKTWTDTQIDEIVDWYYDSKKAESTTQ